MAENKLMDIFSGMIFVLVIFNYLVLMMGLGIVIINDEAIYRIYDISEDILPDSANWALDLMEKLNLTWIGFLDYIDYIWLLAFVIMNFSFVAYSYKLKQESGMSLLSLASLGTMVGVYIMNIMLTFSTWFKNLIFSVMPVLEDKMPYFVWYHEHAITINLIFMGLCIIVNVLDFDKIVKGSEEPNKKFPTLNKKDADDEL